MPLSPPAGRTTSIPGATGAVGHFEMAGLDVDEKRVDTIMLSDTGIIVATLSVDDTYHQRANELIDRLIPPFVTTLPCLTDTPMDFADASLIVMAEELGITRILTFDSHFYANRINGKTPFEVLPR